MASVDSAVVTVFSFSGVERKVPWPAVVQELQPPPVFHSVDFYLGDPEATYRVLRREAPVYWHQLPDGTGVWMLSRWEDIRNVSKRPELFCTSKGVLLNDRLPRAGTKRARYVPQAETIIQMDPPRHGRVRNLVNQVFTPRRVAELEPWMRELCREHFAKLPTREPIDLVSELAAPIPAIAIAHILGVPKEDWRHFQDCANAMIEVAAGDPDGPDPEPAHAVKLGELATDLQRWIRERRDDPRDDLISALVHVEAEGERFDDADVLMMALTLLGAGNETTRTLVSGACLALALHPEQRERLLAEPERMPGAIEEFLRWVTPVHSHTRVATADTEIRGTKIRKGDCLAMLYLSGNRDEEVWPDADVLDIARPPDANPHVSLGHGEHFCLGASLARLEARVVMDELLRRFPHFELAGPPRRLRSTHINGIAAMPVLLAKV